MLGRGGLRISPARPLPRIHASRPPLRARAHRVSVEPLSSPVARFIDEVVDSAETLQVLLLLRSQPGRAWTLEELAASAFSVPRSVEMRLERLRALGYAQADSSASGTVRFVPQDEAGTALLQGVEEAYRTQRVAVVNRIYARSADPLKSFADAFKFRRPP
jgi:hypothetical protein